MKLGKTANADPAAIRSILGYLTEQELFDLLDIAQNTGRNRQSAGTLPPHYKLGKQKLYRIDEVEAWIRRARIARNDLMPIRPNNVGRRR